MPQAARYLRLPAALWICLPRLMANSLGQRLFPTAALYHASGHMPALMLRAVRCLQTLVHNRATALFTSPHGKLARAEPVQAALSHVSRHIFAFVHAADHALSSVVRHTATLRPCSPRLMASSLGQRLHLTGGVIPRQQTHLRLRSCGYSLHRRTVPLFTSPHGKLARASPLSHWRAVLTSTSTYATSLMTLAAYYLRSPAAPPHCGFVRLASWQARPNSACVSPAALSSRQHVHTHLARAACATRSQQPAPAARRI